MVDLLIKGFKSSEEVDEFVTWYTEQGEQDCADWFEEVASDKVRDWIHCDGKKTFPLQEKDGVITMYLGE